MPQPIDLTGPDVETIEMLVRHTLGIAIADPKAIVTGKAIIVTISADGRERFAVKLYHQTSGCGREAKALSTLHSHHCPRMLAHGDLDRPMAVAGRVYAAFVLREWVEGTPPRCAGVIELIRGELDEFSATCTNAGIVIEDVKADNLLLLCDAPGFVWVDMDAFKFVGPGDQGLPMLNGHLADRLARKLPPCASGSHDPVRPKYHHWVAPKGRAR